MGLSDIIEFSMLETSFYKLGHQKAWQISMPVSHLHQYRLSVYTEGFNET